MILWVTAICAAIILLGLLAIDWTPGRFKVIYHFGNNVDHSTKMAAGWLEVKDGAIEITGKERIRLDLTSLESAELFRLHGLGRMIRVLHEGRMFYVSVVRFQIGGQFAVIDAFKTGKLTAVLNSAIMPRLPDNANKDSKVH